MELFLRLRAIPGQALMIEDIKALDARFRIIAMMALGTILGEKLLSICGQLSMRSRWALLARIGGHGPDIQSRKTQAEENRQAGRTRHTHSAGHPSQKQISFRQSTPVAANQNSDNRLRSWL